MGVEKYLLLSFVFLLVLELAMPIIALVTTVRFWASNGDAFGAVGSFMIALPTDVLAIAAVAVTGLVFLGILGSTWLTTVLGLETLAFLLWVVTAFEEKFATLRYSLRLRPH